MLLSRIVSDQIETFVSTSALTFVETSPTAASQCLAQGPARPTQPHSQISLRHIQVGSRHFMRSAIEINLSQNFHMLGPQKRQCGFDTTTRTVIKGYILGAMIAHPREVRVAGLAAAPDIHTSVMIDQRRTEHPVEPGERGIAVLEFRATLENTQVEVLKHVLGSILVPEPANEVSKEVAAIADECLCDGW